MIHQYKSNGYDIVMDVNSGAVHVVDDVTYDVISLYEELDSDSIVEKLKDTYATNDILEAIEEVEQLKNDGQLFTEDIYQPFVEKFKESRQHFVYILLMTAILHASIALRKKASTTEEENL